MRASLIQVGVDEKEPVDSRRERVASLVRENADADLVVLPELWPVGAFAFGLAQVYFFFFIVLPTMRGKGEKAPQKPWEAAEGLEWEVPSPAPFHTFESPPKLDATATKVIG